MNMETNNTNFNESDALKLIEQTISSTKQRLSDDGFSLIMWGWIIITGCVVNYFALEYQQYFLFLYWPIFCTAGGIISGVVGAKRQGGQQASSLSTEVLKYIWMGSGIAAIILWFAAYNFGWQYINSAMLVAFGLPVFISGGLMKFRPAIIGGLLLFVFGVGVFFIAEASYSNLIAAAGWALGYLVPGYLLRKEHQRTDV